MKLKWLGLLGLLGVGIFLWLISHFFTGGSAATYRTAKIDRGDLQRTVRATGSLKAVVTVLVGSQISGRIQEIIVDFNSRVKKDQVIAQIDPALYESQLAIAEAKLASAEAELVNMERDLKRQQELRKEKVVAQSEFDKVEAACQKALGARDQAKAEVQSAKTNLQYTTIRSPVDGIVISRDVDVGQTVAASLQAPTLFTIAKDLAEMQIHVSVDEADVGQVQEGEQVLFTVDTYPGETFVGKVTQVRNAPVEVQNVVHYDVIVSVDNKELKLKPGMTAQVNIVTASKSNVLRIPNAALRFLPEEVDRDVVAKAAGQEAEVWELHFGKPRERKIQVGMKDEFFTEVKEGLQEGEEVIVGQLFQEPKQFRKESPFAKPMSK